METSTLGTGKRVQVEFVSANPTGPLHIGSARNAAIGDTLANLLAAAGYDVQREYYLNDTGNQIRHFAETLYARYAQALGRDEPMPKDGYAGAYMLPIAEAIVQEEGSRFLDIPREEAVAALGDLGLRRVVSRSLDADCRAVGINFDNWFSERSLYSSGLFDRVLGMLKERGLVTEYDGAVWFCLQGAGAGQGQRHRAVDGRRAHLLRSATSPTCGTSWWIGALTGRSTSGGPTIRATCRG